MGWLHVGMRGMSSPSLPYRHMLVDSNDPLRLGRLLQLAMDRGSGLLQDDLNSHDLSSVDFFHLSCSGFNQNGASELIFPSDVKVEKTVITDPNHDLSPPPNARIGKRFVCLLDADLRTEIQGIEEFVADLNRYYARLDSQMTEALILFTDQTPPEVSHSALPFEMDENNQLQGLWNNPVWGYVRIFSNKSPAKVPLHDDKERALVITDFSAQSAPEVTGVFAYQNYVIGNMERRLYTGLAHFISQYQSLKRSLVSTSKRFIDAKTEEMSPISMLHSVAYDPLILHPTQSITKIDSASLYCNIDKSTRLWGSNHRPQSWEGSRRFRSLWDLSSGLYENPNITELCMSFVSFLREPSEHTYGEFVSSLNEYSTTVLHESAEIYDESENIHKLAQKIDSIITEQFQGGKVPSYHLTNRKYSKNLSHLVSFIDDKVDTDKDEFEQRINNPNLVALMLRAKFSDYLHEMILQLFTDEPVQQRSIKTYHLGGVPNG